MNEKTRAAFQACFSDFKLVKGRKVAQVVLELPIEAADAALEALGGVPRPDREAWVAVARIDRKAISKAVTTADNPAKEPRPFHSLPLVQQCGILCKTPEFQRFIRENYPVDAYLGDEISAAVRDICGVDSRGKLASDYDAAFKWQKLTDKYAAWKIVG